MATSEEKKAIMRAGGAGNYGTVDGEFRKLSSSEVKTNRKNYKERKQWGKEQSKMTKTEAEGWVGTDRWVEKQKRKASSGLSNGLYNDDGSRAYTGTKYDNWYDNMGTVGSGSATGGIRNSSVSSSLTSGVSGTGYTTGDLKNLYGTLLKGQQDAVRAGVDASVSDALYERGKLKPMYDEARNGAYTTARVSAIGNNEALANQGLAGALNMTPLSGTSETSRIAQNISMQDAINSFTKQEQEALNTIDREILKAKTAGNVELARLATENKAQLQQALIDKKQRDFEAQQAAQEKAFQEQVATIGQYGDNYQAKIEELEKTNPNDPLIPYLKLARNDKIKAQYEAQIEAEREAFDQWAEKRRIDIAQQQANTSSYNAHKNDGKEEENDLDQFIDDYNSLKVAGSKLYTVDGETDWDAVDTYTMKQLGVDPYVYLPENHGGVEKYDIRTLVSAIKKQSNQDSANALFTRYAQYMTESQIKYVMAQ